MSNATDEIPAICPFCGSKNTHANYWNTNKYQGFQCDDCHKLFYVTFNFRDGILVSITSFIPKNMRDTGVEV